MRRFLPIISLLLMLSAHVVSAANEEKEHRIIRGVVMFEDNTPVLGAMIVATEISVGAVTGPDGDFSISLPTDVKSIQVSYIGYEDTEIALSLAQTYYEIFLKEEVSNIDEVVVIGFGHARRSDLTGAVTSMSKSDIEDRNVTSVDELMKGRVAGLQISSVDGSPGGASNITIRGGGSINASSTPLYVIDGVPTVVESDDDMNTNPLSYINPDDIESISVLKDASATAVYGSRGANGVIVVKTKQAQAGKVKLTYTSSYSVSLLSEGLDVLNSEELSYFQNEQDNRYPWVTSGNSIYGSSTWATYKEELAELEATDWSQVTDTDWQKEIQRNAFSMKHQINLTGGTKETKYVINIDYNDVEGTVKETGYSRLYARADLTTKINDWLTFSTNNRFARTETDGKAQAEGNGTSSGGGIFIRALRYSPLIEYDENIYMDEDSDLATGNPLTTLYETVYNKVKNSTMSSNSLDFTFSDNFSFKTLVSATLEDSKLTQFYSSETAQATRVSGTAKLGDTNKVDIYNENIFHYNKLFNKIHSIDLMGGTTLQWTKTEKFYANAANFLFDDLEAYNIALGSNFVNPTSYVSKSTLLSGVMRTNYSYDNRYVATASIRADGSSRFAEGHKWGYFPSGAFAWNVSQEEFMPESDLLSNLKLRLSWGQTGNQEIGIYKSLQTYSIVNTAFDDTVDRGLTISQIDNSDLTWEVTTQYNAGIDLSLFKNCLSIYVDAYHKSTTNLLLNVPVPASSGFTTQFANIGQVDNTGVEVALHANLIRGSKDRLNVDFDFNIAFNKNEVVDLGYTDAFYSSLSYHSSASDQVIVKEGEALGSWYGYECDGIFQYGDPDLDRLTLVQGSVPTAGDWKYVDQNDDGVINEDDRVILGNSQPKFYGGFSTGFSLKNFTLRFMFNYSYGADVFNATRLIMTDMQSSGNLLAEVNDRWVGPDWQTYSNGSFIYNSDGTPLIVEGSGNASNTVPRAGYVSTYELQDSYIEDGSFLRLSSINLSYNFPYSACRKLGVSKLTVWTAANNVWLWTNYTGSDPEVNMDPDGYGNIISGYDYDSYPKVTSFTLGMKLIF